MGKNSGTTRSGGSSNPKGAGEAMNTYADFKNSQRLKTMVENVEKIIDKIDDANTNDDLMTLFDQGRQAIDAYRTAATGAARGLRAGMEDAEDLMDSKIQELKIKLNGKFDRASRWISIETLSRSVTHGDSFYKDMSVKQLQDQRGKIRNALLEIRSILVKNGEDQSEKEVIIKGLLKEIDRVNARIVMKRKRK